MGLFNRRLIVGSRWIEIGEFGQRFHVILEVTLLIFSNEVVCYMV